MPYPCPSQQLQTRPKSAWQSITVRTRPRFETRLSPPSFSLVSCPLQNNTDEHLSVRAGPRPPPKVHHGLSCILQMDSIIVT